MATSGSVLIRHALACLDHTPQYGDQLDQHNDIAAATLLNLPCIQEYQVRVLDAHKYEATQRLQQGCAILTDKVEQLNGLVRTYLDILDKQVGSTNVSAV